MTVFFVLAALLLLQSALSLRDGYRFVAYLRRSLRQPRGTYCPFAAVIVASKGVDADFSGHVTNLLNQDYPDYQLIFAVASNADPAYERLAALLGVTGRASASNPAASLVVAGYSDERGEKVNNLLCALGAVKPGVEVLAFADTDATMPPGWLRSLVAPLADPAVTVSTGFRWYLPGESVGSQVRAAWDTSIAMLLGDHRRNLAWGGSMAMRAADFKRLRIAEQYWQATVSDDYAVARAVRDARGWIRFEPRCLVASREESGLADFVRWANRQIILTRVYAADLWRLGLASHSLFAGTVTLGVLLLAFSGASPARKLVAAALLGAIYALGLAKASLRSRVARELFPDEAPSLRRYASRYWVWWPLVPWIMLFNFVTAGFTRCIEWRGTRYEMISATEVRVLERQHP